MTASHGAPILVHSDGSVTAPSQHVTNQLNSGKAQWVRYGFGLPMNPPGRAEPEDDGGPICHTVWEKDGIRYTQKVLVTRLGTNALAAPGVAADDGVLLVQLSGYNSASEYTTASAIFEVRVEDRPLNLELRDALVFVTGTKATAPLAAVDVPSGGVAGTNGLQLRFQGSMPPATSGSMTVKIPLGRLTSDSAVSRLMDLEFDEEERRVKQAWKAQGIPDPRTLPIRRAERSK